VSSSFRFTSSSVLRREGETHDAKAAASVPTILSRIAEMSSPATPEDCTGACVVRRSLRPAPVEEAMAVAVAVAGTIERSARFP